MLYPGHMTIVQNIQLQRQRQNDSQLIGQYTVDWSQTSGDKLSSSQEQ